VVMVMLRSLVVISVVVDCRLDDCGGVEEESEAGRASVLGVTSRPARWR
jgi:hypothetical protein